MALSPSVPIFQTKPVPRGLGRCDHGAGEEGVLSDLCLHKNHKGETLTSTLRNPRVEAQIPAPAPAASPSMTAQWPCGASWFDGDPSTRHPQLEGGLHGRDDGSPPNPHPTALGVAWGPAGLGALPPSTAHENWAAQNPAGSPGVLSSSTGPAGPRRGAEGPPEALRTGTRLQSAPWRHRGPARGLLLRPHPLRPRPARTRASGPYLRAPPPRPSPPSGPGLRGGAGRARREGPGPRGGAGRARREGPGPRGGAGRARWEGPGPRGGASSVGGAGLVGF
jgi:hypothetical protein